MAFFQVDYVSEVLGKSMQMNVMLPQTMRSGAGAPPPDGYPVLWLLHGWSENHTAWQRNTSIERYVKNAAVIMPDAHLSFYNDMVHGPAYFTHLTEELPEICRSFFPISSRREDNFVAGLSMGGYGAFKVALSKPENYAAAACLSAYNFAVDFARQAQRPNNEKWMATMYNIYGDIFPNLEGGKWDLFALSQKILDEGKPRPRLFHIVGTEDIGYAGAQATRKHYEALEGNPFEYVYKEYPGIHNWEFWDGHVCEALEYFGLELKERK